MISLAAEEGYQSVSVAEVGSRAGVSSATFYEQFDGKEACMIAACELSAQRLLARMRPVEDAGRWRPQALAALQRVLGAAQDDPLAARVLLIESMAGEEPLHEQRRRTIRLFERRAEAFLDAAARDGLVIDLPPIAMLGALRSVIARHLRTHAEDQLVGIAEDVLAWIESYAAPADASRWSTSDAALLAPGAARKLGKPPAARAPARLPRGRHGLPPSAVTRSRRTRIIHATAEVMMTKGYANATVSDIVRAAGVSRDVFYAHFADKQQAFLEAQQYPTQHILDACAAAYFSADEWPERVWRGLRTLIALIVENPALSHLRLVECYAAGPTAARRAEEITRAFTIFLEEGYRLRPQAEPLPHLCSQAIGGAVFEVIQQQTARRDYAALARRLPLMVYLAIAPFVGARPAADTVGRLAAQRD